jgi:hypothetical protein
MGGAATLPSSMAMQQKKPDLSAGLAFFVYSDINFESARLPGGEGDRPAAERGIRR